MPSTGLLMVSFPLCKINLGLNVINKRPDGFHDIATCFYPVPWNDVLEVVPAKDFTFQASGDPIPGTAADNLCVRAYELLKKDFKIGPVSMHLLKVIPTGAGLGGGSSNGAFALRLLNDVFNLALTDERLEEYASRLGSDCAFFIQAKPAIGTGRGEILSPANVSLKGKFLVIIKPEVNISTAQAYSEIVPQVPNEAVRSIVENRDVNEWKQLLRNDFEPSIFRRFPVIEAIHTKLYAFGANYASMSGSGSAVYGIFDREVELKNEFADMRYWSGYLD